MSHKSPQIMELQKRKILIVTGLFIPGWKGGGLIKTVVNLVENLKSEFDFYVLTSDRDQGEAEPYTGINFNVWIENDYKVMYLDRNHSTLSNISRIISSVPFDVIYLNSFFSPYTIYSLAYLWRKKYSGKVVLAPKGEFAWASLGQKYLKKFIYMKLAKALGFFNNVIWHASSRFERDDIIKVLKIPGSSIREAIDIPIIYNNMREQNNTQEGLKFSLDRPLRIIFLSRIVQEKNLVFCLEVLKEAAVSIIFDIYGPLEDSEYWLKCQLYISKLPTNVICTYRGYVAPADVPKAFADYDLFLFPSGGENYGHVIAESLLVGTPVLVSDQTPWDELGERKIGWVIDLNSSRFLETIHNFAGGLMESEFYDRKHIKASALTYLASFNDIGQNRDLFIN